MVSCGAPPGRASSVQPVVGKSLEHSSAAPALDSTGTSHSTRSVTPVAFTCAAEVTTMALAPGAAMFAFLMQPIWL